MMQSYGGLFHGLCRYFDTRVGPRAQLGPPLFFRLASRAPRIRRRFFEACVPRQEDEVQISRGAVALLGDDQLRLRAILVWQVRLVEIWPVDEEHHVGILFDRARFAQVRELRL